VRVIGAVHTDRGVVRRDNQDSYGFCAATGLYLVADGMGGRAAGKYASGEAASVVLEKIEASRGEATSGAERLRRAIESANAHVWWLSQSDQTLSGMGTTIAAVLIEDDVVSIANVGDSRVCRIRDGVLAVLTHDHSYLNELTERGIELPDPDTRRRYANMLTRAVGIGPAVEVDVTSEPLAAGDVYLICSDGVHRPVNADELCAVVAAGGEDLEGVCRTIVDRANAAGGPDNSTIIVLRVAADELSGPTPGEGATA
jgi:protein phosphatase